jgi:hypothetical protein
MATVVALLVSVCSSVALGRCRSLYAAPSYSGILKLSAQGIMVADRVRTSHGAALGESIVISDSLREDEMFTFSGVTMGD